MGRLPSTHSLAIIRFGLAGKATMKPNAEAPAVRAAMACPHCQAILPQDARTCPSCGLDLALLALLAERAYLEGIPQAAPLPTTPAAVVPRIGEYLLQQGLLRQEELESALRRQAELAGAGERRFLGQTLVEMGLIDRETLDRALTRQIIELHAALQQANRTLEQRVAERTIELRRALERMSELNQLKANLISNVSHELRTPLAHIKGYVELIAEGKLGPLSAEQEKALSVVRRASERLQRLIDDLIAYSSASREGLLLERRAVNLQSLAQRALARTQEKAAKAGVSLETDIPSDLPAVEADPERIVWVLYQLVDNGIKFTPAGGRVRLCGRSSDERVTVSVQDTGIGIPSNRLEEIFEPFHQLDGSTTRRYGGTGLGLALVKLILDGHGAPIEVESEEGMGTTVRFSLPAARSER